MTQTQHLRPDFSDTLKLSEFAATLGVSTRTVRRWIKAGDLTALQTKGGHYRIPTSELERHFLTTAQFAHLVGVHPLTVRRWCRSARIAHATTATGRYRIPYSEVPRFSPKRRAR